MKPIFLIALLFCIVSCHREVCQECLVIKESNKEAVISGIKKIGAGAIYQLDRRPFTELESSHFVSCDISEMARVENLDNLLEIRTVVYEGLILQYQVRWFANCKLIE